MNGKSSTDLLSPDEKFWTRYSPHFELPLAGMASLLAHGFVLGALTLGGLALLFQSSIEASKPPSMDVVTLDGSGGDGLDEGGGTVGAPGLEKQVESTEPIENKQTAALPSEQNQPMPLPASLPSLDLTSMEPNDVLSTLDNIAKAADAQVQREIKPPPKKPAEMKSAAVKLPGMARKEGGRPGTIGLGNLGSGSGNGKKKGPAFGQGGMPGGGRAATKQEIFAFRWRFDLAGGAKEHAAKLAAVGVTLAIPDPRGTYLVINDLTRRPVELRKNDLAAYKDAVKWKNDKPESVQELARELRLPFVPPFVVLLLPKDREEKMAAEEARYAEEQRRDVKLVRATWFDFRQRDGQYEPVAIRQE